MADLAANLRGWGNPDAANFRRDHIITVKVQGVLLPVRREVAPIFVGFLSELCSTTGYRLDGVADDWGYANRCIRGTGPGTSRACVKSNHSWGLAIDVNATKNPMTFDGRLITDMPATTGLIAAKWGLRWGANYTGTSKDAMHFEFMGRPEDVKRYPTGGSVSPTAVTPANSAPDRITLEDGTVNKLVEVKHLAYGVGQAVWDPGLGRDPVIQGAVVNGPSPDHEAGTDKWWMHQAKLNVRAQARSGKVVVVVTGFERFPDAAYVHVTVA